MLVVIEAYSISSVESRDSLSFSIASARAPLPWDPREEAVARAMAMCTPLTPAALVRAPLREGLVEICLSPVHTGDCASVVARMTR